MKTPLNYNICNVAIVDWIKSLLCLKNDSSCGLYTINVYYDNISSVQWSDHFIAFTQNIHLCPHMKLWLPKIRIGMS